MDPGAVKLLRYTGHGHVIILFFLWTFSYAVGPVRCGSFTYMTLFVPLFVHSCGHIIVHHP